MSGERRKGWVRAAGRAPCSWVVHPEAALQVLSAGETPAEVSFQRRKEVFCRLAEAPSSE